MSIKTSWPQTTDDAPPSWIPKKPSLPSNGNPLGTCLARSRTIIVDSVLAFFEGEEVVDDVGLAFDVGEVQFAAQCPTCPQRRDRVALALEAAEPRCGGLDCRRDGFPLILPLPLPLLLPFEGLRGACELAGIDCPPSVKATTGK